MKYIKLIIAVLITGIAIYILLCTGAGLFLAISIKNLKTN